MKKPFTRSYTAQEDYIVRFMAENGSNALEISNKLGNRSTYSVKQYCRNNKLTLNDYHIEHPIVIEKARVDKLMAGVFYESYENVGNS